MDIEAGEGQVYETPKLKRFGAFLERTLASADPTVFVTGGLTGVVQVEGTEGCVVLGSGAFCPESIS